MDQSIREHLLVISVRLLHEDVCNLSFVNKGTYKYVSDSWGLFALNNYGFDIHRSKGRNKSQKYKLIEINMLCDYIEFANSNYRRNALLSYKFNLHNMIQADDKNGKALYYYIKSLCIAYEDPNISFATYVSNIQKVMKHLPLFTTNYLFKYGIVELNNKNRKKVILQQIQERLPALFSLALELNVNAHFNFIKIDKFTAMLSEWDKDEQILFLDNFFPVSTFPIARKYFFSC